MATAGCFAVGHRARFAFSAGVAPDDGLEMGADPQFVQQQGRKAFGFIGDDGQLALGAQFFEGPGHAII